MDTDTIDHLGTRSLEAWLRQIDAVEDRGQIAQWVGRAQGAFHAPFALGIGADYKHPDRYVVTVWQGGLGLPNRDYYLKDDARFASARAAYSAYLQTLLRNIGDPDPTAGAADVFAFERRLAQAQWEPEANRDAEKTYNPAEVGQLPKQSPGFDWDRFLRAAGLERVATVVVGQPSYATAAPLATSRQRGRRRAGRGGRTGLCGALLSARLLGARAGAGAKPDRRLSRIDRRPGLDDGPDQAARAREAGQVHAEDRLPGEVARLVQAADQRERRTGQRAARRTLRIRARGRAHWPAGRSGRMGNDAANGQCVLSENAQRDRLPGRGPAAAV